MVGPMHFCKVVGYAGRAFNQRMRTTSRLFARRLHLGPGLRRGDGLEDRGSNGGGVSRIGNEGAYTAGLNSHFFHADSTAFGYCGLPRLPL